MWYRMDSMLNELMSMSSGSNRYVTHSVIDVDDNQTRFFTQLIIEYSTNDNTREWQTQSHFNNEQYNEQHEKWGEKWGQTKVTKETLENLSKSTNTSTSVYRWSVCPTALDWKVDMMHTIDSSFFSARRICFLSESEQEQFILTLVFCSFQWFSQLHLHFNCIFQLWNEIKWGGLLLLKCSRDGNRRGMLVIHAVHSFDNLIRDITDMDIIWEPTTDWCFKEC